MRRSVALLLLLVALVATSSANAASWAQPQIRMVVSSGLMGPSVERFRPNDPLTRAELAVVVAGITGQAQVVVDPGRQLKMWELDRALVHALGLSPAAREVWAELDATGLTPVGRAGSETVARLLRLRFNHPASADWRELRPHDLATRAEAAYSVARVLELSQWDRDRASALASDFDLPALTNWQRRVLQRATRFVGYPYVWGGTSEFPQTLFGVSSRGGFDCSGFVWRVYKLQPWTGAPRLGSTLVGRTSYAMAGEVPRTKRIARANLRAADVIFFGARGPRSAPSEVNHMGIYVGGGWFVQSSSQGTTLAPLEGWYADTFAWGRRPLAEVGLR
jgi:cell wall-associated NlpC family hydrolase